jgi:hypothetical protein
LSCPDPLGFGEIIVFKIVDESSGVQRRRSEINTS